MSEQLSFALDVREARGREDFIISPANATAVAMIDRTEHWPNNKLALSGPLGSGKSHLAHVWAAQTNATLLAARDVVDLDLVSLTPGPLVLEDLPTIAGQRDAEEAAFHLHNLLAAAGHPLLMTGQRAPRFWGLTLPDLQSRVEGAAHVELEAPDDALLAAVLEKLFSDRQLTPKSNVIPYLLRHMERSFSAAGHMVDALDKAALAESRGITRDLARDLIAKAQDDDA